MLPNVARGRAASPWHPLATGCRRTRHHAVELRRDLSYDGNPRLRPQIVRSVRSTEFEWNEMVDDEAAAPFRAVSRTRYRWHRECGTARCDASERSRASRCPAPSHADRTHPAARGSQRRPPPGAVMSGDNAKIATCDEAPQPRPDSTFRASSWGERAGAVARNRPPTSRREAASRPRDRTRTSTPPQ